MKDLLIPIEFGPVELVIKKSRFLGWIAHAPDRNSAQARIQAIREAYPDARHVCWAYVAGECGNTTEVACHDDGEPSGTAGKPILNVLQQSELSEVLAVVVRYFGGIKLGAGGLLRAYSATAAEALRQTPVVSRIAKVPLQLAADYPLEDRIRRLLMQYGAVLSTVDYAEQLYLHCEVPAAVLDELLAALTTTCSGQITIKLPAEH